ncbi:MAG: hypothetical protein ACRD1K_02240 [Acidimicrobiales bacterium]
MLARLAAVGAAVAMVVAAIFVRGRLDDTGERSASTLRLVCSTEMAPTCADLAAADDRLTVTVERAEDTAARLLGAASDPGFDGWLVAGPWPVFVAEARQRAGSEALVGTGAVLARSPVVLLVWPDRATVLASGCGGDIGWSCLGGVAGTRWSNLGGPVQWGPVKPGHPPVGTAEGLAVVGAATVGFFGRADVSRADLDDDGYRRWLARLERNLGSATASPVETMLLQGPAAFDAVGAIEAVAKPRLDRSARPDKPTPIYPSPMATADVVLGTVAGRAGQLLTELLRSRAGRDAFVGHGWAVAATANPTPSGLPEPGVLDALRELVGETAR